MKTLLLAASIALLISSCAPRRPDGSALPPHFPTGITLEEFNDLHDYGAAQDPPWWPVACEKNKSSK